MVVSEPQVVIVCERALSMAEVSDIEEAIKKICPNAAVDVEHELPCMVCPHCGLGVR